uniref:Uncharacterized protein n=1 Tax=Arion vulgaris TaxID=1028688 RepID=A0A0B7AXR7_9EUPU
MCLPLHTYEMRLDTNYTDHKGLSKEGGRLPQTDHEISYEEARTTIGWQHKEKWSKDHPQHSSRDGYYGLS